MRSLNEFEMKCIKKYFDTDFKGKRILENQIENAKVVSEIGYDYYSLKLFTSKMTERYPYKVRVPVEMHIFQQGDAPIVCLLHIIDGLIDEFEIITADSSCIRDKIEGISFGKVEYVISKEVIVDRNETGVLNN